MVNHWVALIAATLGVLQSSFGFGQETYPNRSIRLIVPQPPGGPNDTLSRVLGQKLTESLKQQVIIDNRGGAGGIIGGNLASQATPDGYTLLFGGPGVLATAPAMNKLPPYDPIKDFASISLVGTAQHVLLIHPSLPAKNVNELIQLAKTTPGKLTFGAGFGSPTHIAGELFKSLANVDLTHIAYKGGGPVLIDLLAGRVTMYFSGISSAIPRISDGTLRGIAVTGAKRHPILPDTPTVAESVPGYELVNWYSVQAPAGTPQQVITRLNSAVVKAMAMADVKKRFADLGSDPVSSTPEELGVFVRNEIVKWTKVINLAGIKPK